MRLSNLPFAEIALVCLCLVSDLLTLLSFSPHPFGRSSVLSLDGGGTRGAFSMRLLQRLCKAFPNLLDEVDIIAGTSTGT